MPKKTSHLPIQFLLLWLVVQIVYAIYSFYSGSDLNLDSNANFWDYCAQALKDVTFATLLTVVAFLLIPARALGKKT